jgi:DNA repair protein RecN (Recombination protein N)
MLTELKIRNYAVIDDVHVELGPGLNVLSGETGAGKSIIVGALSLLLGERAAADVIRVGEERAIVEGVFDLPDDPRLRSRCDELGIDLSDDCLILRRELQREGRNRAWVNGSPATAAVIGELGGALVDLHGQHEHQALLRPAPQRRIVDSFAGAGTVAAEVSSAWEARRATRTALEAMRRRIAEARENAELLRSTANEIESAEIEPGEEEFLAAEIRRLEHSEELLVLSGELHEVVYGGDGAVVDRLGGLRRALDSLLRIDPEATGIEELYETGQATLDELGRRLRDYRFQVEHDPARLASLRQRQDLLYRLRRKYGGTLEDVKAEGHRTRTELDSIETSEDEIERLEGEERDLHEALSVLATRLGEARRQAAERLQREVTDQLPDLGMPGGRFCVELTPLEEPGPDGAETIRFLVSLNPGFDPGPLSRVASGGELSRVMLALKSVLASVDAVPSLVFDEIDAGIGGRVAHHVAGRLWTVAGSHQVFAITHLAQIAARADVHLRVEKAEQAGRVVTRLVQLQDEVRVEELARMLGGDPESDASLRHARELLDRAAGDVVQNS